VVVVGEAPGNEEAVAGRPFIGKSGHLVRDLLDRLSCSHYITNSVKCHPPRNKTPDDIMVAACRYYLRRELKETKPAIIVTFGNTAYKSVTGEDGNLALIGEQGMKNGSVIYHMPHPAYILRNPHSKTVLWDEPMEKLIELSKRLKR
jgi:DNA polymerase